MTPIEITIVVTYSLIIAVWVRRYFIATRVRRELVFLQAEPEGLQDGPLVSVIIPARDEEQSIGDCLRSILAQTYTSIEVIVVDDRSRDRTREITQEIAGTDPRVRVLVTAELPPGWTGKTHALDTGVRYARGEWLLFVDADTWHEPNNIGVVMEYARSQNADMISLLPRMHSGSFWERVVLPLSGFVLMVHFPLWRVNDDADRNTAFADGQYILVRRSAYEAVGGFASVRDKIVEDVNLARRVKAHGFRLRVASGLYISSTRMYTSLGELTRAWSRMVYGAADHRATKVALTMAIICLLSISAYAVPATVVVALALGAQGALPWVLLAMSAGHIALMFSVLYHMYALGGHDRRYLPLYLLACLVMLYVLVLTMQKCVTHRVVWRGILYDGLGSAGRQQRPPTAE